MNVRMAARIQRVKTGRMPLKFRMMQTNTSSALCSRTIWLRRMRYRRPIRLRLRLSMANAPRFPCKLSSAAKMKRICTPTKTLRLMHLRTSKAKKKYWKDVSKPHNRNLVQLERRALFKKIYMGLHEAFRIEDLKKWAERESYNATLEKIFKGDSEVMKAIGDAKFEERAKSLSEG